MLLRRMPLLLALVLSLAVSGCFGIFGGGGEDEPEAHATISVRNDLDPLSPVTIDLRRGGRTAAALGSVAGGREAALSYASSELQGTYQLLARQSSGAAVVSREFTLFDGARVEWNLARNTLTVLESR